MSKKRKMPSCVRVIGMEIPIRIRSADRDPFLDEKYGYCDHGRTRIRLNAKNSEEQHKECAVHEILHAVSEACKLDFDEDTVARLSRALFALLRENPQLTAWLQAHE